MLSLCARGYLKAAVSQPVLLEAQRNILNKLGDTATQRFYNLLAIVPYRLSAIPQDIEGQHFFSKKGINPKDVHVIAAALAVDAPFLLSLDIGLLQEVNSAQLGIVALLPGDFIKSILIRHTDYRREE